MILNRQQAEKQKTQILKKEKKQKKVQENKEFKNLLHNIEIRKVRNEKQQIHNNRYIKILTKRVKTN